MKVFYATALVLSVACTAKAQLQIPNGGFESWGGNTNPPSNATAIPNEPTGWYSNQSGNVIAQNGPQTCFKDGTIKHSGSFSVRLESKEVNLGVVTVVVNGNVTTGIVNAPTFDKSYGYIGTTNFDNANDVRRTSFTGRPDSLVGWYQYVPANSNEQGKVRVILHTGQYYDPEVQSGGFHPDPSANKIGDALFYTPKATVSNWTRFSVPFNYVSASNPAYIMINMTSSADQNTTVSGSKMWLDDLQVVYSGTGVNTVTQANNKAELYCYSKTLYTDFAVQNSLQYELVIYNATGQKIISEKISGDKTYALDLSAQPAGLYFYTLQGRDVQQSGKFVLQ